MSRVHDLLQRHKNMLARRDPWVTYWQRIAEVMLPNQADFISKKKDGEQRGAGIFDGTPRLALRDLATTIDGLLKPKSTSWFDVEVDDPDLMAYEEVKLWTQTVKDRMWNALYQPDARFIQRSGEVDTSLCAFGWGVLWIGVNTALNGLLFKSFHNNQVAIDENVEGNVDALTIMEMFTPRQAEGLYRKAGLEPGRQVKQSLESSSNQTQKKFEFVQLVLPNDDWDARRIDVRGKRYVSVLLDVAEEKVIAETGFHEFPAAVPRWETAPNELYARSPGMIALPDALTLQAMGKTLLVGGQRAVDPPIWVTNDSVMSPLRTFPGGITVFDTSDSPGQTPVGTFPVAHNSIPLGREMQGDYRRQVEAAFFRNVFQLPVDSPQMTATEVLARKEEYVRVMGPVFGRLETDYIGKVVNRVFNIMERAWAFPQRPEMLLGRHITFRFQSPIQKARKQMEIAALAQSLGFITPLAEAQPEILDNFDGDKITRDAPEWGSLPQKWLRPEEEVQKMRAARAQGQLAQQQLAAAGPISEAIKNVSDAQLLPPQQASMPGG